MVYPKKVLIKCYTCNRFFEHEQNTKHHIYFHCKYCGKAHRYKKEEIIDYPEEPQDLIEEIRFTLRRGKKHNLPARRDLTNHLSPQEFISRLQNYNEELYSSRFSLFRGNLL